MVPVVGVIKARVEFLGQDVKRSISWCGVGDWHPHIQDTRLEGTGAFRAQLK